MATRQREARNERNTRTTSTKGGSSTKSKKSRALSLDPEDNLQFGLVDDVDFTITGAYYAPWNMNGKLERDGVPFHLLGLHIEYDLGEEDPHVEAYSAGYLDAYAPSEDGIDPAGGDDNDYLDLNSGDLEEASEDMRGPWKVPVRADGKTERSAGSKRTGEHFFFECLRKAATAAGVDIAFKDEDGSPLNVEQILVGISGHAGRLKQRDEDKNGILVPTEIFEAKGGKKKRKATKPPGAKTAGKSRARDDEDDTEEEEEEEEETPQTSRSRRSSGKPAATRRGRARDEEDEDEDDSEEEEDKKPARRSSSRGKATGKTTSAKSLPDDADEQVEEAIREMLDEAGGKLKKSLLGDIADKFETQSMAKYALSCIGDPDYLGSLEGIAYDAKKQLLTLEEEDEE